MSSRKSIGHITSTSLENSQEYLRNSWEYYKLKLFLHTAELSTHIVKCGVLAILGISMLFMVSIAFALFLGELLNSLSLGFLIVGLSYSVALLVTYLLRGRIESLVVKGLAKNILEDE